jgi:hypothetical protein
MKSLYSRALAISRSVVRYHPVRTVDTPIRRRLHELAVFRPSYGMRRLRVLLRRDGLRINLRRCAGSISRRLAVEAVDSFHSCPPPYRELGPQATMLSKRRPARPGSGDPRRFEPPLFVEDNHLPILCKATRCTSHSSRCRATSTSRPMYRGVVLAGRLIVAKRCPFASNTNHSPPSPPAHPPSQWASSAGS